MAVIAVNKFNFIQSNTSIYLGFIPLHVGGNKRRVFKLLLV